MMVGFFDLAFDASMPLKDLFPAQNAGGAGQLDKSEEVFSAQLAMDCVLLRGTKLGTRFDFAQRPEPVEGQPSVAAA